MSYLELILIKESVRNMKRFVLSLLTSLNLIWNVDGDVDGMSHIYVHG